SRLQLSGKNFNRCGLPRSAWSEETKNLPAFYRKTQILNCWLVGEDFCHRVHFNDIFHLSFLLNLFRLLPVANYRLTGKDSGNIIFQVKGAISGVNGAYFMPNIPFNSAILLFDNGIDDFFASSRTRL